MKKANERKGKRDQYGLLSLVAEGLRNREMSGFGGRSVSLTCCN
jgi:hypothetical protein